MEAWQVYYHARYDAVPWPFAKPWERLVEAPEPLVYPARELAFVSPLDGLDETGSVPPNLPRAMPVGRHAMAIYHDQRHLYVFLESIDGPPIPDLAQDARVYSAVTAMSAEDDFVWCFMRGDQKLDASIRPYVSGKRRRVPPPRELAWDFRTVRVGGAELECWRIARASLEGAWVGDTLKLSVSRLCCRTLEAVAWGSNHTWGSRHDEMGLVRLVAQRPERPHWPIVKRIEMRYDAAAERATFALDWEGVYEPGEESGLGKSPATSIPWLRCGLTVNGEIVMLPLTERTESPAFPLVEGENVVQVSNAGGPMVRLSVEKRSGNRIHEPVWPRKPAVSAEEIGRRIRASYEKAIAAAEARRATGEPMKFTGGLTWRAASMGRAYHYVERDPRLLEVLREEADFALSLQRPDGTFAGFHLARYGHEAAPWRGGAFDSGPAGDLYALAGFLLKDEKYTDASRRLLRAYKDYRVDYNHNYAAFALYHMATHYRVTGDELALVHGRYYSRHCVLPNLLPLGVHPGHNYYTIYSGIVLTAMATFATALPAGDPLRGVMTERCVRMANQLLSRMQHDGTCDARDRFHVGRRLWLPGVLDVAFMVGPEDVERIDAVFMRMLHTPEEIIGNAGTPKGGPIWFETLHDMSVTRYVGHREALLAGRTIDAMRIL